MKGPRPSQMLLIPGEGALSASQEPQPGCALSSVCSQMTGLKECVWNDTVHKRHRAWNSRFCPLSSSHTAHLRTLKVGRPRGHDVVGREPDRMNTSSFQSGPSRNGTIVLLPCGPPGKGTGPGCTWGWWGGMSPARQRNSQVSEDPGLRLPVWILLPRIFVSRQAPHTLSYLGHSLARRPVLAPHLCHD